VNWENGIWEFLVGLGIFGRSKPKRFRKGFWQMIHRGGASEGFWRLGVFGVFGGWEFLGVFGVFGPKYGKNASKSVVFGNSCN